MLRDTWQPVIDQIYGAERMQMAPQVPQTTMQLHVAPSGMLPLPIDTPSASAIAATQFVAGSSRSTVNPALDEFHAPIQQNIWEGDCTAALSVDIECPVQVIDVPGPVRVSRGLRCPHKFGDPSTGSLWFGHIMLIWVVQRIKRSASEKTSPAKIMRAGFFGGMCHRLRSMRAGVLMADERAVSEPGGRQGMCGARFWPGRRLKDKMREGGGAG
ncbi:hypothetical protein B0H13DRAFT_1854659 [Mycena leptocephala]|nr:hypothetical protein B0H13DRAFT_1854659 [Mycena leptocephala]